MIPLYLCMRACMYDLDYFGSEIIWRTLELLSMLLQALPLLKLWGICKLNEQIIGSTTDDLLSTLLWGTQGRRIPIGSVFLLTCSYTFPSRSFQQLSALGSHVRGIAETRVWLGPQKINVLRYYDHSGCDGNVVKSDLLREELNLLFFIYDDVIQQ